MVDTNRDKPVFVCSFCQATFNIQNNLCRHIEKMHRKPPADNIDYKYACELCDNKFQSHETYARHVEKFHEQAGPEEERREGGVYVRVTGEDNDMTEISLTEFISQQGDDIAFPGHSSDHVDIL